MRRRLFGWEVQFSLFDDWRKQDNWKVFTVGCYKETGVPPHGSYARRGLDYRGFIFRMSVWVPFRVEQWR